MHFEATTPCHASAKLLGAIVHECLRFDGHVRYITAICTQRMYLLKRLRDRRLPVNQLNIVYESLIVNRIRYAIPVRRPGRLCYC